MRKLLVVTLVMATIVISSCSDTTTGPGGGGEVTVNNPLPLAVGNWWGYLNIQETGKSDTTRDTIRIIGTDIVNGHNTYVIVMRDDEGNIDTTYVYRDGEFIHTIERVIGDSMVTTNFVKVPFSTGDSWTVYSISDSTYSITVIARVIGSANVSVPVGSFSSAAEVEQQFIWSYTYGGTTYSDTSYSYFYFADNIGVIQIEDVEDSTRTVSKLEDYHLE